MKRLIYAALLTGMLLAPMSLSAQAASTAVSSHNGSIVRAELKGNTLSVFGRLNYPTAESIWVQCGSVRYANDPNCKIFRVTPGEYFSVDLDISSLNADSDIMVLYAPAGAETYQYHDYKCFALEKKTSPVTGREYWDITVKKNPGDDGAADAAYALFAPILNAPDTEVSLPDKATSLTTSYNPENFVEVTLDDGKAVVTGALLQDTHDRGWLRWTTHRGNGDIHFDLQSGETFRGELPLVGSDYISLLTAAPGENTYWYRFNKCFYVLQDDNGGYSLDMPPFASHNATQMSRWVNLADTFDSEITDAVRKKSNEICAGITNDYDKLWALHNWVAENIHYDYDSFYSGKSTVYTPDEVLRERRSVCEGYAALLEAFCEAQGIPALRTATYAAGITNNQDFRTMYRLPTSTNHAHTEAFADGRWVIMDPTWDSQNRYENGVFDTNPTDIIAYFDVPAEFFAADHIILERDAQTDRTDIPSDWAKEEVLAAMGQNLVHPDLQSDYVLPITRAEFSKLIVNAMINMSVTVDMNEITPFSDTDDSYVLLAASMGIVNGYEDGTFRPTLAITREQAAVMLNRAAGLMGIQSGAPMQFSDIGKSASWARDAVLAVSGMVSDSGKRVMGGVGDGFDPLGSYTRQQAILTVLRLMNCR